MRFLVVVVAVVVVDLVDLGSHHEVETTAVEFQSYCFDHLAADRVRSIRLPQTAQAVVAVAAVAAAAAAALHQRCIVVVVAVVDCSCCCCQ